MSTLDRRSLEIHVKKKIQRIQCDTFMTEKRLALTLDPNVKAICSGLLIGYRESIECLRSLLRAIGEIE